MSEKKFTWNRFLKRDWGIGRLFYNNKFVLIFSIVCAVIIWVVGVFTMEESLERTIYNVPVNIPTVGNSLEAQSLQVVEGQSQTVKVTISGKRLQVAALEANDIIVTANISNVTGKGSYSLPLTVEAPEGVSVVSVDPGSISASFDKLGEKTFTLMADLKNIRIEKGFYSEKEVTSIQEVTVTGSDSMVERVDRVVVEVSSDQMLKETVILSGPVKAVDKDGNEIEGVRISAEQAQVTIPIYKKAAVPLRLIFSNVPADFESSPPSYSLSKQTIEVGGDEKDIDALTEITVGPIDFKEISPGSGSKFELNVNLPSGIRNVSNLMSVTAELNLSGMTSRTFAVSRFSCINVPGGKNVSVLTDQLSEVTIVGPSSVLGNLLSEDLTAVIDLKSKSPSDGESTIPVTYVTVANHGSCWGAGEYNVRIKCENKS
ncbi:MAG: hypothetical protein HFE85_02640 [Clostridiales bacterium]|nr:hypothetical protein [Clostridiales bacterium]